MDYIAALDEFFLIGVDRADRATRWNSGGSICRTILTFEILMLPNEDVIIGRKRLLGIVIIENPAYCLPTRRGTSVKNHTYNEGAPLSPING